MLDKCFRYGEDSLYEEKKTSTKKCIPTELWEKQKIVNKMPSIVCYAISSSHSVKCFLDCVAFDKNKYFVYYYIWI